MCEYIILNEQRLPPTSQSYWYRYFYQFDPTGIKVYILKMSSSSVQFSHSVMWLPCPSPTPGACSNSCPLSQWCHPIISSSVIPFSSCLQSSPASGSFPVNQFFASGGQSIGVSASASILPMNIQDWFPLGLTGWISLQSKGLSRVFSNPTVRKHQFFGVQLPCTTIFNRWVVFLFFTHIQTCHCYTDIEYIFLVYNWLRYTVIDTNKGQDIMKFLHNLQNIKQR